MDEELRAHPDDLVALMRAGRLSPERVAMAAYLGDARALATGLEPWKPAYPLWIIAGRHARPWPARVLLTGRSSLTTRERAWLLCLCAEHAVAKGWSHGPEAAETLQAVRRWCRGEAPADDAYACARALAQVVDRLEARIRASLIDAEAIHGRNAGSAVYHAAILAASEFLEPADEPIDASIAYAAEVGGASEEAWQDQAIAAVLLDPNWPPWAQQNSLPLEAGWM